MRIRYIKLKNFAGIFTAMKRKELEIDFSKGNENTPINILIGANGSGKTTVLSMLQPFSNVGNLDPKNATTLILENHDGYKEIHIEDNDDLYVIKHFYSNKKATKTLKSFISRNGEELNKNGNVSSFKELVYTELGLEQDYLKLLRLGPNVTNFIDMKAADRKSFITDLLSDVDVYSTIYRRVSDKAKLHSGMIKSCSERLNRLNIVNEETTVEELKYIEDQMELAMTESTNVSVLIGKYLSEVKALLDVSSDSTLEERSSVIETRLKICNKEIKDMEELLEKHSGGIKVDIESYEEIVDNIAKLKSQIEIKESVFNTVMKTLDRLYEALMEKKIQLDRCSSRDSIKTAKQSIREIEERIKGYDKRIKSLNSSIDKESITSALSLFQYIDKLIIDIMEYDPNIVREVFNIISRGESVEAYANKNMKRLDKKIDYMRIELQKQNNGIDLTKTFKACKPCNCQVDSCPYETFYNAVMTSSTNKTALDEIDSLERQYEVYQNYININSIYNTISRIVMTNKTNIEKLPKEFVNITDIFKTIATRCEHVYYNEAGLTSLISIIEEKEDYEKDMDMIEELNNQIKAMEINIKLEDSIIEEYNKMELDIMEHTKSSRKISNELRTLQKNLEISERAEKIIRTVVFEYDDKKKERIELTDTYNDLKRRMTEVKVIENKITSLKDQLYKLNHSYKVHEANKMNKTNALENYRSLSIELLKLERTFDELKVIREAVSSSKGIPLLFIQLYLMNTKNRVNSLLERVFGAELQIDDFIINEKEFKIPYIKNGIRVEDIAFSSQGEGSFISLALSFALIDQSLDKYNILLLDEIDATLDTKNRANFIKILEEQLKSIDAQQVFMITHNNMFDSYPVNVIMTSPTEVDNFTNVTVIHK